MRIINKKYLLAILLVGIIITGGIIFKPKENVKLDNVILKQEINNKTFAMYTETDNGYEEYNGNSFPKGQRLNKSLSKCIDKNGEEIKDAINVDNESGNISVKSNKSFSCYLYFDNKIEDLSGKGNNGVNYAQLWTEEGITTSLDSNNLGYVDCGLANHDFKDGITIIVRARINKHTTDRNGRLLSNNETELVMNKIRTPSATLFNNQWFGYGPDISLDIFYDYAILYDKLTASFILNGQNIESINYSTDLIISNYPFYLGAVPNWENQNSFATFTDVLIFDSALTEEEIKENFSSEIDKDKVINTYVKNHESNQNLLLYYKFN